MTEITIDTKKHSVRLHLELSGEPEPVEIYVRKYSLKRSEDATLVTIVDATASREWIAAALQEFVVGQSFPLPKPVAAALSVLG